MTGQQLDLAGRLVLVTGATRGLGLAIARKLCASGCEVLLNYAHDEAAAEAAVKTLAADGGTVSLLRADVGDPAEVRDMLDQVQRARGRLDVFVHNAAFHRPAPVTAIAPEIYRRLTQVTVGPLLYGAAQLVELLPAGSGRIIAVSSTGAHRVVPNYAALGSAKAALEATLRYLAVELAGQGITVNAVCAGKLAKDAEPDELSARVAARTPAGRLTRPEDVADVIALLCRAEAGWIHGETITVDGGLRLLA
jgi:enoyl-[acyl-carrier protein] reductase III